LEYQNGEVVVTPHTIYWVQMPVNITENDKIELLKRDILIIDCSYVIEDFPKLIEKLDKNVAFFYNLDRILGKSKIDNEIVMSSKIAKFISKFAPEKSIIHTSLLNETIRDLFRSEGLIYLEKNLNDKVGAVNIVLELIKPIFSEENTVRRAFLRVNLYPAIKYKVEIVSNASGVPITHCYLKDISLNGIGVLLLDKKEIMYFSLKESVQVKIYTPTSILKIPGAFITRRDEDKGELGFNYNINDRGMIKEETAAFLTKIVYKWTQDIINQHGRLG